MRDKEPKVEEVEVSHTRGLYSGRAVPQKASLPPSEHLLFCHGDSENIALISRIPMPIPKVTMTFSISSNLVKLIFSYGIDEVLDFDNLTLISCVSVVAAVLGTDELALAWVTGSSRLAQDARRVVSAFCCLSDCEFASGAPQASSQV